MACEIVGLFPTPLMWVDTAIDAEMAAQLVGRFKSDATLVNSQSTLLAHTELAALGGDALLEKLNQQISPSIVSFGEVLFGEKLEWTVKEMWVNVLQNGGRQAMHNHANSFVSGIIYLTRSHTSANTVFIKSPRGHDFVFNNCRIDTTTSSYNADKWVSPDPRPGDMVLFPSYLLHEIPINEGSQRITLAFNAIPNRLDSWGYSIQFSG